MDRKAILNLITEDTVIEIMSDYGSPLCQVTTDSKTGQRLLWFVTVCHGGDSHKLCYFTESKNFYCYTNCGYISMVGMMQKLMGFDKDDKKGYAIALDDLARRVDYEDRSHYGFAEDDFFNVESSRDYEPAPSFNTTYSPIIKNKIYDENILKFLNRGLYYKEWIDEGISVETMRKYEIGSYPGMAYITIPHRDKNGNLIGVRRRSFEPDDAKNKYMPLYCNGAFFDHPLGYNLYGLYQNKKYIWLTGQAVLVEGEKSVLKGDTYFGEKNNLVATCGFNVSPQQIKDLKELGVNTVYIAFDRDYNFYGDDLYKEKREDAIGYLRYLDKLESIVSLLEKEDFVAYIILDREKPEEMVLLKKDSPIDRGKENFEMLKSLAVDADTFYGLKQSKAIKIKKALETLE